MPARPTSASQQSTATTGRPGFVQSMAASAVHQLLRVRYGTVDAKKVPVTIRSGREPVVLAFSGL